MAPTPPPRGVVAPERSGDTFPQALGEEERRRQAAEPPPGPPAPKPQPRPPLRARSPSHSSCVPRPAPAATSHSPNPDPTSKSLKRASALCLSLPGVPALGVDGRLLGRRERAHGDGVRELLLVPTEYVEFDHGFRTSLSRKFATFSPTVHALSGMCVCWWKDMLEWRCAAIFP